MSDTSNQSPGPGRRRIVISLVTCVVVVALAAGAVVWINQTEPTAERGGATRKTAALVETTTVRRGSYRPQIQVLGLVEPARDIVLSPRVSGQIIGVDAAFMPGGIVEAGQPLLEIDPADFENALAMRRSDLEQAKAELAIEQGRQSVAQQEFELLDESISAANQALVLRQPQIDAIRARVHAAQAAVAQAELDLQRTRITAPFDAQIIRRSCNVGSQVARGDELARLVGVDEYWVMATVPLRHLRWIAMPEQDDEASAVRLRNPGTWEPDAYRTGRVERMIGTVDDQTRLARVLITVPDPLSRRGDDPPLVLGSLLDTHIRGRTIENVIRLSRDHVHEGDTVWVMAEGRLSIREATVVFRDALFAYIREGLETGDQVVTTGLATVVEGLALRRQGRSTDPNAPESP